MPLAPEVYENAWKNDKSIRAMAETVFREWREEIKQAETAWELTRLIESELDPDKALSVILGIMALDSKDAEIGRLGAGPLEDFLNHSGPEYIDVIEQLAAKNPRFKKVLMGVWQTATMDLAVWKRSKESAGMSVIESELIRVQRGRLTPPFQLAGAGKSAGRTSGNPSGYRSQSAAHW